MEHLHNRAVVARNKRVIFGFLLLATLSVMSCDPEMAHLKNNDMNGREPSEGVRTPKTSIDPEFEKNRKKWGNHSIAHYRMTITASQGGNITFPGPAEIEVMNGVVRTLSIPSITEVDDLVHKRWEPVNTIEKIFDLMEKGYADGANVDAEYDEKFGYPKDVEIDDFKKGIDSWTIIKIADLEPLDR